MTNVYKVIIIASIILVICLIIGIDNMFEMSLKQLCGSDMTIDVCLSVSYSYSYHSNFIRFFDNLLYLNNKYHELVNDTSKVCMLNQSCEYDHLRTLENQISDIFYHGNVYHQYFDVPTSHGNFHTLVMSTHHITNRKPAPNSSIQCLHTNSDSNMSCIDNMNTSISRPATELSKHKTLLLIHGYGTASTFAWRNTLNQFMPRYEVIHAIDLPGFGRSLAPDKMYHEETNASVVIQMYCDWFDQLYIQLNLTNT